MMKLIENGKFLGRTPESWAKITAFYSVYYSFLTGLIYFTVTKYAGSLPLPGGTPPKIVTRVDMPGATVFPFQLVPSEIDKDGELHMSSVSDAKGHNAIYYEKMDQFIESYNKNTGIAKSCVISASPATATCAVANAKVFNDLNLADQIANKKPIVAVTLNKIYNWLPLNSKGLANGHPFVKDSVQMDCFEAKNDGSRVADSQFEVNLLGIEKALLPSYYPYTGQDKYPKDSSDNIPYNKPFMLAEIVPTSDNAWKLSTDQKMKYFRCELHADNVLAPLTGSAFYDGSDDGRSWSNDLTKLGLGFVQFAFTFDA